MKKFFAIAVIAAAFASCAGSETKTDETTSSDTTTIVAPAEPVAADTLQVVTDTTVKTTVTTDTVKVN